MSAPDPAGAGLPDPIGSARSPSSPSRIAVACSGGRDSIALLHATLCESRVCGAEVVALHVHHGLSSSADAWLEHVRGQCAAWAETIAPVRFEVVRVAVDRRGGESLEARAREARYRALAQAARACGVGIVLLAHHRRDQAETLLLQALRGGGIAGLASMPEAIERDGIVWRRPWLAQPRERIEAYVARHRLTHVDDDSNADPRHARNRLRAAVWPALLDAFPSAESSLSMTAHWAQQAGELLDEIARSDLGKLVVDDGLDVRAWSGLSLARRSNALRAWLARGLGRAAPASLVTRLLVELPGSSVGRWPTPVGELRLFAGSLRLSDRLAVAAHGIGETWLTVGGPGRYPVPAWRGELRIEPTDTGEPGLALAWPAHLGLRPRGGDDRFQPSPGRPARMLKKQFRQAGVPAWQRDGPVVHDGARLLFVPGLGLDARVVAPTDTPGRVTLRWCPRSDAPGSTSTSMSMPV